jgi:hypothetical protein
MTSDVLVVISGKTAFQLGKRVSDKLRKGYVLHGSTWSSGAGGTIEFHQAVILHSPTIGREPIVKWD